MWNLSWPQMIHQVKAHAEHSLIHVFGVSWRTSNACMYFSFLQESPCDRVSCTIFLWYANLPIIMSQEQFFIIMLSTFIFMLTVQLWVSLKRDIFRSFFCLAGIKSLMFQNQIPLNTGKMELLADWFLKFAKKYQFYFSNLWWPSVLLQTGI